MIRRRAMAGRRRMAGRWWPVTRWREKARPVGKAGVELTTSDRQMAQIQIEAPESLPLPVIGPPGQRAILDDASGGLGRWRCDDQRWRTPGGSFCRGLRGSGLCGLHPVQHFALAWTDAAVADGGDGLPVQFEHLGRDIAGWPIAIVAHPGRIGPGEHLGPDRRGQQE